ncbi:MAG: hypothetical protein IH823_03975 [Candidatus Dadabacteria bacterium]|nr:hypothetical protein [Candidatus Dadabacteria bacterium]
MFRARNINYERGAKTEHNIKLDFLFPESIEYHNKSFPENCLTMLGIKTTCKDRWRQVLNEAARIKSKHILILEPGIIDN